MCIYIYQTISVLLLPLGTGRGCDPWCWQSSSLISRLQERNKPKWMYSVAGNFFCSNDEIQVLVSVSPRFMNHAYLPSGTGETNEVAANTWGTRRTRQIGFTKNDRSIGTNTQKDLRFIYRLLLPIFLFEGLLGGFLVQVNLQGKSPYGKGKIFADSWTKLIQSWRRTSEPGWNLSFPTFWGIHYTIQLHFFSMGAGPKQASSMISMYYVAYHWSYTHNGKIPWEHGLVDAQRLAHGRIDWDT